MGISPFKQIYKNNEVDDDDDVLTKNIVGLPEMFYVIASVNKFFKSHLFANLL